MKRKLFLMESIEEDTHRSTSDSKVRLVERNESPNGYHLLNSRSVGRHGALDLVSLAQEIQNTDVAAYSQTGKLSLILDQIRFLQSQANQILTDMKTDQNLHNAACNFKKVPGKVYHLYERESGQRYFSMLSPQEWGPSLTHKYLGGYRLETDQTWTPLERLAESDDKRRFTQQVINAAENRRSTEGKNSGLFLMDST